ncbi:MAG TPA: glycoside hydrolase family 2 TIM barrel-domain containing protein [Candidatus Kapabacteria bacterium]|nr:glycoside hydrolase family 2 TIM barrel-domain containing protein [Candidatus Kapabacteria bacterium]
MRKLLSLLLLATIAPLVLEAQTQPKHFLAPPPVPDRSVYSMLTSAGTRSIVSLNGVWQVSSDGRDSWSPVQVPSCFEDEGTLHYKRSFQIPAGLLQKYRWKLVCYGVQYQTTIRINGQFVGQHESGMPFSIMVPEEVALKGSNTVELEVSNRLDYTSTVPHRKLMLGSRTYGGIFRDIMLVGVPRIWIDDVRFQTTVGANASAKFFVRVTSGSLKGMVAGTPDDSAGRTLTIDGDRGDFETTVILRSPSGVDTIPASDVGRGATPFTLESKRTANMSVTVPVSSPRLWAPGSPTLYTATVQVRYQGALVDEQVLRVGFRSLGVQGPNVLLNGQPIPIKGIVYVEDVDRHGASLPYDLMRRDIQAIKDRGANLVRFADGMPHPYLLQLCDEFGLMAWIDAPIGSPPASLFADEDYLRRATDRIRFLIEEAGRFTSVTAYGVSSPVPGGSSAALSAIRRMRALVDSLDDRPFYFGASSWADPQLRAAVDIAGVGTFDVEPARMREMLAAMRRDIGTSKPLVVLSYGKFVQLGNHGGYSDPISIEAQAKYVSDIYNILLESKVAGGIYWAFSDYRTDRPILTVNNGEQAIATSGLFGLDRELRQSANMLGSLYTNQKPPEVLIGDYTPPSTVLFIIVGIASALAFLLLINNSRRFRENVFRSLSRPYNFFADIRDQRILSNVHTTILGVVIAATFALIVASVCFYFRMDEGFDALLSAIVTSDSMKAGLNYLVWRPALSIAAFTIVFFLALLAVAGLIRACAVFVRNRIFFNDAYTIAVWGALPVLLLIPLAMILYRILEWHDASVMILSVILVAVFLWMLYRILRGTSVVYDVRPTKVYGYALGGILALSLVLYFTSGAVRSRASYLWEGIGGMYQGSSEG